MDDFITIKNFSKSFGKKKAVDDLSFEVKKGEIFAFLGANGSGKTTTIRTLLGIYSADAGELLIDNKKYTQEMSQILGYLPEERGLYLNSKVLETLVYFGELKGIKSKESKKRAEAYLERVGLADKASVKIAKLSSGQQQKVQLGITFINQPPLLILDEPTRGLDPVNRSILMDMLMEMNKAGSTIVFSTHQMEETERIAHRLVMIKEGKRVLYGDVNEVKNSFGDNKIHVSFKGKLNKNDKLFTSQIDNNFATIDPNDGVSSSEILKYLVSEGVQITKFEVTTPSLNEIFIKVSQNE